METEIALADTGEEPYFDARVVRVEQVSADAEQLVLSIEGAHYTLALSSGERVTYKIAPGEMLRLYGSLGGGARGMAKVTHTVTEVLWMRTPEEQEAYQHGRDAAATRHLQRAMGPIVGDLKRLYLAHELHGPLVEDSARVEALRVQLAAMDHTRRHNLLARIARDLFLMEEALGAWTHSDDTPLMRVAQFYSWTVAVLGVNVLPPR